jgi:ribosomal-protein-alanine N-acetyltransferase
MSATRDHIDHIMVVMEAAFDPAYGEAWNRRQVTDALTMPSTHALIIDEDGNLIGEEDADPAGFVMTRYAADEEELLLIAVMPDLRERGLGKRLIEQLFDAARARGVNRIFLEMRRGNPAVHLYRKLGFEPIGERPNYYRMTNGERVDAITFGCSI